MNYFHPLFALSLLDGVGSACPTGGGQHCNVGVSDLLRLLQNAINYALFAAGMLAIIFIIVGGIRYAASQGNPGSLEQAKKTITYAIVGLLVAGMALGIVNFFSLTGGGIF